MSSFEPSVVPFDSISSGALRMALRRWYIIVLAVVVGGLAIFLLSDRSTHYVAVQSSRMVNLSAATGFLEQPLAQTDINATARRAATTHTDDEFGDDISWSVVGDNLAGTLEMSASAATETAALEALEEVRETVQGMIVEDAVLSVSSTVLSIEAEAALVEGRIAELDEAISLVESGLSGATLIGERSTLSAELGALRSDLVRVENYLQLLNEQLFVDNDPTVSSETGSITTVAIAGIGIAMVSLIACALLVALDGRLRRRIQVQHFVPEVTTISVLPRHETDHDIVATQRAIIEFLSLHVDEPAQENRTALLQPISGITTDLHRKIIQNLEVAGVTVDLLDDARASAQYGQATTTVIYFIEFGDTTHNQLSGLATQTFMAGNDDVGIIMTSVPKQDFAWASA